MKIGFYEGGRSDLISVLVALFNKEISDVKTSTTMNIEDKKELTAKIRSKFKNKIKQVEKSLF